MFTKLLKFIICLDERFVCEKYERGADACSAFLVYNEDESQLLKSGLKPFFSFHHGGKKLPSLCSERHALLITSFHHPACLSISSKAGMIIIIILYFLVW